MRTLSRLWMVPVLMSLGACSSDSTPMGDATELGIPAELPGAGEPGWPRFHGPNGDNISTETGLLEQWPETGPPLVWRAEGIGHGFASVTIGNGRIYTAGNIEDETVVTCLDASGEIVWQTPNGRAWTSSHPGARGTPTLDGDRVYHESPYGDVVCLKAETGDKVWELNILEEFGGKNIQWALAESLLIDGDHLICCPGGGKASVAALDKMSGRTVWTAESTGQTTSYASPALAECQGLRMILTMSAKALIGVNADTGKLLFEHKHITQYDVNALMPLYHGGRVFISSGYGSGSELLELHVQGDGAKVERVWESKELDNHHGGVVLLDGYVHGAAHSSHGGGWICLNWDTGEMAYAEEGVGKGSLTSAEGMLYTMNEEKVIGLVRATPKGHTVVSQFELPSDGEGPTWAHPVICGGHLYIRHSDYLFCYDVRKEQP